jgi:hypothetical protein
VNGETIRVSSRFNQKLTAARRLRREAVFYCAEFNAAFSPLFSPLAQTYIDGV